MTNPPYIQITNHNFPQLTKFRGKHNEKDIFSVVYP